MLGVIPAAGLDSVPNNRIIKVLQNGNPSADTLCAKLVKDPTTNPNQLYGRVGADWYTGCETAGSSCCASNISQTPTPTVTVTPSTSVPMVFWRFKKCTGNTAGPVVYCSVPASLSGRQALLSIKAKNDTGDPIENCQDWCNKKSSGRLEPTNGCFLYIKIGTDVYRLARGSSSTTNGNGYLSPTSRLRVVNQPDQDDTYVTLSGVHTAYHMKKQGSWDDDACFGAENDSACEIAKNEPANCPNPVIKFTSHQDNLQAWNFNCEDTTNKVSEAVMAASANSISIKSRIEIKDSDNNGLEEGTSLNLKIKTEFSNDNVNTQMIENEDNGMTYWMQSGGDALQHIATEPEIKLHYVNNEWQAVDGQSQIDIVRTYSNGITTFEMELKLNDWRGLLTHMKDMTSRPHPINSTETFTQTIEDNGSSETPTITNEGPELALTWPVPSVFIAIKGGQNASNPLEAFGTWIATEDRTICTKSTDYDPGGAGGNTTASCGDWGQHTKVTELINVGGEGDPGLSFTWETLATCTPVGDNENQCNYDGAVPTAWTTALTPVPPAADLTFCTQVDSSLTINPDGSAAGQDLREGLHKRVITYAGVEGDTGNTQFTAYMHVPNSAVQFEDPNG